MTEEMEFQTVGKHNGKTVAGTSPDDFGEVQLAGAENAESLLQAIKRHDDTDDMSLTEIPNSEKGLRREIDKRLPVDAELLDDGRLRVPNQRNNGTYHYLNGKRREILKRLDRGVAPLDVAEQMDLNNSYVYRARSAFDFLLCDSLLKEVFVEDGGRFAPEYVEEKDAEEEAEESTSLGDLFAVDDGDDEEEDSEMVIRSEKARESPIDTSPSVYDLFDGDEWWDLMKFLLKNGREGQARQIAANISFD